jgi:predicted nucleotide-binding protein
MLSKAKPSTTSAESQDTKKQPVTFPKNSLKEALRLARAIQDNNAGAPYNRLDLAKAVGYSPESSGFRTLIASSSRYGLTVGSHGAEKIALTDLGSPIVAPRNEEEKNTSLLQALKNIDVFKRVFQRFDQAKLPRDDLLKNTLVRDFGISQQDADGCLKILKENIAEWGIQDITEGNAWLRLDKLSSATTEEAVLPPSDDGTEKAQEEKPPESPIPQVFISHSKNAKILDQIKTILEFGQFHFIVAEEVETTSIPIPEKIFGLMSQCNSAIINISADENEKDPDGTYRINPNVLIEIGGAFLAYNGRVILLTDKRVKLPSNLQGLYRCEYEGDELSFNAAMKLQKELSQFRTIA